MTLAPYYSDDAVTIYHGDCREITEWLNADVVVTDPPYGIQHDRHGGNSPLIAGETKTGRSSTRVLDGSHVAVRDEALKLWGARPALVFGYWRAPRPERTMMRLIWDKGVIGMGGVGAWRPSDEEIYLTNWPNPKSEGGSLGSVVRYPANRGADRNDHPTPKPLGLMVSLLENCPPGVIADPFMGSGTTLRAAKDLGRKAIGIEVDERYCEIAAKRMAQGALDLFGAAS